LFALKAELASPKARLARRSLIGLRYQTGSILPPGALAPASLPRMILRASLPRASEPHFYKGSSPALRPLMLLSALRPGTVFAGIASFNLSS
jgi:hypothetical protein